MKELIKKIKELTTRLNGINEKVSVARGRIKGKTDQFKASIGKIEDGKEKETAEAAHAEYIAKETAELNKLEGEYNGVLKELNEATDKLEAEKVAEKETKEHNEDKTKAVTPETKRVEELLEKVGNLEKIINEVTDGEKRKAFLDNIKNNYQDVDYDVLVSDPHLLKMVMKRVETGNVKSEEEYKALFSSMPYLKAKENAKVASGGPAGQKETKPKTLSEALKGLNRR